MIVFFTTIIIQNGYYGSDCGSSINICTYIQIEFKKMLVLLHQPMTILQLQIGPMSKHFNVLKLLLQPHLLATLATPIF